jgi:hypothetical protein
LTPLQNPTLLTPLETWTVFSSELNTVKVSNGVNSEVTPLQNRTVLDSEFPKVGFCNGVTPLENNTVFNLEFNKVKFSNGVNKVRFCNGVTPPKTQFGKPRLIETISRGLLTG